MENGMLRMKSRELAGWGGGAERAEVGEEQKEDGGTKRVLNVGARLKEW